MSPSELEIDAAIEQLDDGYCPRCHAQVLLEEEYDDCGTHRMLSCQLGHTWPLEPGRDITYDRDGIADRLEEGR